MSERQRRRAFVAAVVAVAVALAVSAVVSPRSRESAQRSAGEPETVIPRDGEQHVRREPSRSFPPRGTEPPSPRASPAAAATARRFVVAFIRYQHGSLDGPTRQRLVATTSPRVARQLLDRPPRDARQAPTARFVRVRVYGPWRRRAKASALFAYSGSPERSLLEFALARDGSRWRVVELYP